MLFYCLTRLVVDSYLSGMGADRQETVRCGGCSIRELESIFTLLYQNVFGINRLAVYGQCYFR
ncbi:MAG: hypothetical protein KKB51_25075 [Candidatus Riflebacteria bacterium]|nr:hypothetical protein [Candidatus Riflebacteria bacterium]